jgi:predicted alpha/beta superfamily hydrolase
MNSTLVVRHAALVLLLFAFALHPLTAAAAGTSEVPNAADVPSDLSFGKRHILHSKVLGRDQEIWIYTPPGYEDSATNPLVPVLYFPDAGTQYLHLAGLVDFLVRDAQQIPPLVLVGIANRGDNRRTELTPTFSSEQKAGGEAEKLYHFIRDEVIPYTEARYRAAPFRILAGASLAGLFALDVLREHPDTFDAVIAASPSLWWDDRVLMKNTAPWGRDRQFLFFTMEKPDRETPHPSAAREFSRILRERAAPGLKWAFKGYPEEWHGSIYHRSFYDGLQFIFPDWNFALAADPTGDVTYAQLIGHQAKLSQRYGYEIPVSLATIQAVLNQLIPATMASAQSEADEIALKKRFQAAIALCTAHVARLPNSSVAHALLARVCQRAGDSVAARTHYQKAIELDPTNTAAKRALAELSSAK